MADEGEDLLPITFSIVGVQKAATSTLHHSIIQHRLVARADRKELHFFDNEGHDWDSGQVPAYGAVRRRPWQRVAGDSSPTYIFWPQALPRMRAYNPEMRLIASFRDPIERAFSHWSMGSARNADDPDFPDFPAAVERYADLPLPERIPERRVGTPVRQLTMFARGRYGEQLRRGLEVFDRDQWLLLTFEQVVGDHRATLDLVTDHLGIHRYRKYPELQRANASSPRLRGRPPSAADLRRLADLYADDLAVFTRLSGLDTSRWATSRILAGELDPAELAERLGRKAGLLG